MSSALFLGREDEEEGGWEMLIARRSIVVVGPNSVGGNQEGIEEDTWVEGCFLEDGR